MKRRRSRKCEFFDTLLKKLGDKISPYQEDILKEIYEEEIIERLEDLNEYLGREITSKERRGLLDIVSEYTPRDKDGEFLVDYLPFEYAWEIYEAKKEAKLDEFVDKLSEFFRE